MLSEDERTVLHVSVSEMPRSPNTDHKGAPNEHGLLEDCLVKFVPVVEIVQVHGIFEG